MASTLRLGCDDVHNPRGRGEGAIIEIQATAEKATFGEAEYAAMLGLAKAGISELVALQKLAAAAA